MTEVSQRQRNILIYLCLVLVTAGVYWPVGRFGFINYDDPLYITENPHLRGGLTFTGLVWAFTTPLDQWMPVTWLARILEYRLVDLHAGVHHLVNVLFHIANALLLFNVLNRMTAAPWRSALVGALFALHPLHVEAVAWVTGLKDVLSVFFGMLTIWAYVRYVEQFTVQPFDKLRAGGSRLEVFYGLTVLFFALALMSKPMAVTMPFVLLLLDYWPLGRTRWAKSAIGERIKVAPSQLFKEKLPFFALTAASCVVTYWAQHSVGAVMSLERLPMEMRIANAAIYYIGYLGKAFWPTGLAVFYPMRPGLPAAAVMGAGAGLAGITAMAIRLARREPWLATGWFWFLGTLVPVIGLLQVGDVSMADRYTYLPLTGLFIMAAWCIPSKAGEQRVQKMILTAAVAILLGVYAVLCFFQVCCWKDNETLFRHALAVTKGNWVAHNNLGAALAHAGRVQEAIGQYEQAVQVKPDLAEAHNNLGTALERAGRTPEAIGHWERALRLRPDFAEAHCNLGITLVQQGRVPEAVEHFEQALRIRPNYAEAHYNLGVALARLGRVPEAIEHWEQALRIKPDYPEAHGNLGVALERAGRIQEAVQHYEEALRLDPDYADAHYNLGIVFERAGRVREAIAHYQQAVRIKPDYAEAHNNLGTALARLGRVPEAIGHWEQALRINPNYARAHYNLGVALEESGRASEAMGQYEQALRINPNMAEAQNSLARLQRIQ